jgi:cytosine/adenosine deaminase-related metal-dependent hydrolase
LITLIENGLIITMDPERRIIEGGAIVIQDDRILEIGETSRLKATYKASRIINGANQMVLPGLIDAHAHLTEAIHRGCEGDLSLVPWLTRRAWPLGDALTQEDARVAATLCCLEMIKSGTTCFVEPMLYSKRGFNQIARVIEDAGLRGILSRALMGKVGYGLEEKALSRGLKDDWRSVLDEAVDLIEEWEGRAQGRINVWLGPRVTSACTEELGKQASHIAAKYHTGITLHVAECEEDTAHIRAEHGMSPLEFLQKIDLLNKNVLLCHAVWLDTPDIELLAGSQAKVVHCPSSNLKLASGVARISDMLRKGVTIALGCDGAMANGCYDMFREMKLASLLHKGVTRDPLSLTAERALEMATINGARALSMVDTIGSIETGKKADLIMVNLRQPHLAPLINPIANLVYSATGSDVNTVIINGNIIMQDRRVLTLDEDAILKEAQERAEKIMERAGLERRH